MKHRKSGALVLEDGEIFEGTLFGAPVSAELIQKSARDYGYGEVVFNTGMTGYQEILTDPSYFGQMVCMTYPHIGNTGVNREDVESEKPWCAGFIVHEFCENPSNWRSEGGLEDYLTRASVPGLYGVDTRALTRHLRTRGVVRGVLLPREELSQAQALLQKLPRFEGRDLIREVTTKKPYAWPATRTGNEKYRVVALDFGIKLNQLRLLESHGCTVEVLPATSTSEEVLARKPQGVFLSNGPGDPAQATYAIRTVRDLLGKVPIFGVCMGHQILSLALGAKTYKLKFGHRGANQPVLNRFNGRVEISSHNHGYAVDASTLPSGVRVSHTNLNDQCVEGLTAPEHRAFSVQFHPEAFPGPNDSVLHFEQFTESMRTGHVPKVS
jgi:carbamoyl-phosphate synthase small subunit